MFVHRLPGFPPVHRREHSRSRLPTISPRSQYQASIVGLHGRKTGVGSELRTFAPIPVSEFLTASKYVPMIYQYMHISSKRPTLWGCLPRL
jgi:hypothetical protein